MVNYNETFLRRERAGLCAILAEDISRADKIEQLNAYLRTREGTPSYGCLKRIVTHFLDMPNISSVRRLPYKILTH